MNQSEMILTSDEVRTREREEGRGVFSGWFCSQEIHKISSHI